MVSDFRLNQVPAWFHRWVAHVLEDEKVHHSFDNLHVGMEPSQETAHKLEQARNAKAQPAVIKRLE